MAKAILSGNKTAIEFIRNNLVAQMFETYQILFCHLATNLTQRSKTLFSTGDLAPRMMTSAAMPVLYRPVEAEVLLRPHIETLQTDPKKLGVRVDGG